MKYFKIFLDNISSVLILCLIGYIFVLNSRIQNMNFEIKKQTQENEEFKKYLEGQAKAEVKVVEKLTVKEVLPPDVLKEMKENKEEIASLHKAIVSLSSIVGSGESTDTGEFWEFDNFDLWAKTRKADGLFSYTIKERPLEVTMLDSVFDEDLHKFRIQVRDTRSDTILDVKSYDVQIPHDYFKDTHKKTLWSNKYVRLTAYTGVGVIAYSLLLK